MQNKKQHIITMIIIIVAIGAGAFYGGTVYEKSSLNKQGLLRNQNAQNGNRNGQNGQGGVVRQGGAGFNRAGNGSSGDFATGEIISKDDKSITIKTRDGGSKIIFFADSTTIGKTTAGSIADLNSGEQVMINGKTNSDGSLTAENIQIRPAQ